MNSTSLNKNNDNLSREDHFIIDISQPIDSTDIKVKTTPNKPLKNIAIKLQKANKLAKFK